jgi:hypothetical protein
VGSIRRVEPEREEPHRTSGLLLVLAAAIALTVVGLWIGPLRFLRRGGAPWVNTLPTTFRLWEARPWREHFFLAFLTPADVAQGRAYIHYAQPWLLVLYAFLLPLRWVGIPYERSQVAVCVPYAAVILVLVATHLRSIGGLGLRPAGSRQQLRLVVIALAIGGLLTLPSFWIPFFRFNPEQYFFVPALAFCHLAAADYRGMIRGRSTYLALLAIALFAPLFTPFAVLSWLILWEVRPLGADRSAVSRRRMQWLGSIALIGVATFLLPGLVAHMTPFSGGGSDFRFRSGLDGSQEYFTSMIQAVWTPSYPPGRAWYLFQWPATAIAAIGATAVTSTRVAAKMLRQLFISWIPFLWAVIIFPQAVSIHPYFFDFHLTVGAAFCLAFWIQLPELQDWVSRPAVRLAILMAFAALLMTNLIDLARLGNANIG